jgi:hypothetical protein
MGTSGESGIIVLDNFNPSPSSYFAATTKQIDGWELDDDEALQI